MHEQEAAIIAHETGVDEQLASRLALIGAKVRNLKEHGFEEGVSTRLLIYTGSLVGKGVEPRRAADIAIVNAVSDDPTVQQAIADIVDIVLP